MKIDYARYAYNPAVSDEIMRRVNNTLAVVEQVSASKSLNFNDIAAAFGGIMVELLLQVPADQRGEVYTRYVDILRVEAQIPLLNKLDRPLLNS